MVIEELDEEKEQNKTLLEETFALVAHQWRQPLSEINSIVGNIDNRLYEKGIDDPLIAELLSKIEIVTKQMSQSIDEHRGYFKKITTSISFREFLEQSLSDVTLNLHESGIMFSWNTDVSAQFKGDVKILKQIILTLIDNARDALISRNIYKPVIKLFLEENTHFFLIKICDNAGGISKSVMNKLFESDFTTKHTSEGTGLGLFMAKKLLDEKFDASISVQNVASGVCFTIEIPKEKKI
jgi:signal transduction histidine kinase